jgi:hypothetical protein
MGEDRSFGAPPKSYYELLFQMKCCGVTDAGPNDWLLNRTIPSSCCEDLLPNCTIGSPTMYQEGCSQKLYAYIVGTNYIIGLTLLVTAVTEVVTYFSNSIFHLLVVVDWGCDGTHLVLCLLAEQQDHVDIIFKRQDQYQWHAFLQETSNRGFCFSKFQCSVYRLEFVCTKYVLLKWYLFLGL